MADAQWVPEPETGRWYVNWTDYDGTTFRKYSDERQGSQSYQEPPATYQGQDAVETSGPISSDPRRQHRDGYQESPRYHQSTRSSRHGRRRPPSVAQFSSPTELMGPEWSSEQEAYNGAEEFIWPGSRRTSSAQQDRNLFPCKAAYEGAGVESTTAGIERVALQDYTLQDYNLQDYNYEIGPLYNDPPALSTAGPLSCQWPTSLDATVTPQSNAQFGSNTSKHGSARPPIEVPDNPRSGDSERLDPSYKIRKTGYKRFFGCGRVFQILWTNPGAAANAESENEQFQSQVGYMVAQGQYVYSKIRRFVVVRRNDRSCQCLPVTTYDGKGYMARRINLDQHGLIYDITSEPIDLNITGITKSPLRLRPSKNGARLDTECFVNYGRAYCVDTNVKVKDLGQLDSASRKLLRQYYREIHFPPDEEKSSGPSYTQPSKSLSDQLVDVRGGGGWVRPEPRPTMSDYSGTYGQIGTREGSGTNDQVGEHSTQSHYTISSRPEEPIDVSRLPLEEQNADVKVHDSPSVSRALGVSPLLDEPSQLVPAQNPAISRHSSNSSLYSLASMVFSVTAQSTLSSASSINADPIYQQQLVDLLLDDLELHDLFQKAIRKTSLEKFENNFKRCLVMFSEHLRVEAPSSLPAYAPKLIRKFSTNAAHLIRRFFESTQPSDRSKIEKDIDEATEAIEDADDEMDAEIEGDENEGELPTLEADLVATLSFKMLRENFRIFLESDQVRRAVFECWPAALPWTESVELKYSAFTGLRNLISVRSHERSLTKMLTIVGTDEAAEAINCEEYLLRQWPEIGQCLVRCLEIFLSSNLQLAVRDSTGGISIQMFPVEDASSQTQRGVTMIVWASYRLQGQIAAAASWLSAVLRVSPHQNICKSHVSVRAMRSGASTKQESSEHPKKIIHVTLDPLESIMNPLTCWHSLFPYNVIAHGFAIRPRLKGHGLEISFANLAFASRCLSFVAYEDGLIAHGLKSVIIPMTELKDDDAIQWHFESKAKQPSRKIASIPQILRLRRIDDWYRELDPKQLMDRRCFLGWVEKANVVIGTPNYALEVGPSRAQACPSVKHIQRYELTAGLSILSWATLQGTYVREPVSIPNAISTSQQNDLLDIINTTTDDNAIIFDYGQETGWCLPQASIVLQMAHSMVTMNHYEIYDGDRAVSKNDPRFFGQPSSDGALAACNALKQSFGLKIRKHTAGPGVFVEEDFPVLLAKIWHTISDIAVSLESAVNKLHLVEDLTPKYILGVDLQEALKNKQSMGIRRALVNQPWTHLTIENPVVFFCRNLRPPIVPASITCRSWSNVPLYQNLLVAMGSTVHTFLDSRNDGLAEGLHWCASPPKLIETHQEAENASIRHIQKLQSKRKPSSNATVRAAIQSYLQGAFIFGNGTELKCSERPNSLVIPCKEYSPLRIASISTVSSSGSATSSEPVEESRSTSPRMRSNSTSGESDPDLEESTSKSGPEVSTTQTQPIAVPLEQPLEDLSDLSLGLHELNNVSLRSNDMAEGSRRKGISSIVAKVWKRHEDRSEDRKDKRTRWWP
ncbi:hypothetical protein BDZ45DRAFT_371254 [Acephala macrosclerotiorum]|nr:hypothetical protein BDZ45DRAFT_371254 [Acephala macrosclerotiorum]